MSIKILGGLVKGQSLLVPKGQTIRPTSVMLRRKIFDANQNLDEWVFVDFCAGSGAIGIEAISRGAMELYSIEVNPKVYFHLEKNIGLLKEKLTGMDINLPIKAIKSGCVSWLAKFKENYKFWPQEKKDQTIIFLDPPYEHKKLYKSFVKELYSDEKWFSGRFWLESDNQKGLDQKEASQLLEEFGELKIYKHSQSYILCVKSHSIS